MRVCILNSGSSGNSTVFSVNDTHILLDAGLSGKETVKRLSAEHIEPDRLHGILVSHGHNDHIKGVGVLARRLGIPVYLNAGTMHELPTMVGEIPEKHLISTASRFNIGQIEIETFTIPHDSADPMGFIFNSDRVRAAYITDLGRVNESILNRIFDANLIVIESNHDLDMLINGPYPELLKRRILGPKGHLSNIAAANALTSAIGPRTTTVVLAHLSANNNRPELAETTVREILSEKGLDHIELLVASRDHAMKGLEFQ